MLCPKLSKTVKMLLLMAACKRKQDAAHGATACAIWARQYLHLGGALNILK